MDNPNEYHQQEMDEEESDTKHMEDHGWGLGMSRDRLCATTQHQGRECPGDVFPPAVTPAWLVEAEAALMPQDGGKVQLPEGCTAQFLLRCFLDGLSDSATAEAKPSGWQQAHGLPSPWRGSRWAKACLAVVNASAGSGSEGQWERMGCLVELCSNGSPPAADALLDAIAEAHHSEDPMPGDQVEARERAGEAMVAASVAAAGRKQWRAARALLGRISCEPSMFCRLLIAMESGGRRVWSWLVATAVEVAEKCRRGITSCRGAEVGGGCLGCAAFLSRLLAAKAEAAGWMLALGLVPRETDAPFLGSALGSVLLPGHMASLLGELESLGQNSPGLRHEGYWWLSTLRQSVLLLRCQDGCSASAEPREGLPPRGATIAGDSVQRRGSSPRGSDGNAGRDRDSASRVTRMIAELLNEELAGVLQQGSLHPACACPLASLIEELKPYVPEIHEAIVCVALDWTEEVLGDQDRSAGTDGVAAIILASRVARGNRLPQRLLERMVASPAVAAALPSVHSQDGQEVHRPLLAQAHRKLKEALPICCIGPSTEAIDQSQCLLGQGFQALRGDRLWGHFLSRCVLACGCGGSGRDLGPTWSDGVWNRTAALAPQTSASSTSCACPAALDACAELLRAASSGRPEHGEPFGRIGIVGESDEAKSQRVVGLIDASLALLADDSLASALVARWVQLLQAPGWDCVKSQGPCSRDSAVRLLLRYRGALQVTAAAAWDTPALPLCSASALLRQLGALARKPQVGNGKVLGRGRRRRLTGGDEAPAVNVGMEEALQGTAILARLIRGSAEAAGGRVNDMTASLNAGVPLGMLLPCGSDEAWVSTCRLVFDEARALTVGAMGQGGCVGSQYLAAAAAVSASASVMEAACLRLLGRLPRSGLEGLAQGLVRRAGLRPQSWEPEAEVELDTSTCRAMRNMRISGSIWIPMDEWEPSTSRQSNGGQHPEAESFPCPAVRYLSREFEGAFTPEEQLNAVSEALQAVVPTCARGTWTAFKSAIEVLPLSAALLCSAAGWLRGLRTKSREGSGLGVFAGRGVPDLSEEMLRLLAALTDLAAAEQRLVLNQHHEGSEIQLRQNTRKALIQACSKGVLPLQVTARWVQRAFSTADSSACFPADLLLRGAAVLQRATSPTCAVALAASACVLASHALRQGSSGQEHRANDAQWMEALGLLVAVSHERWVPLLQGLARHIWWGNPDTPGAAVPAATCAHAMLPSVVGYLQASSDALRKTSCRADEKAGVWASAAERSLVLPCLQAACVALGASRLRAEGKQDEFESALVADAKAAVAWWGNQAANLLELLLAQSAPDQPKHPATVAAAVWAIAASFRSRRVSPARGPRSGPKGRTSLDRALDAATARLLALCGKGHLSDGNAVKMAVCAAANVAHLSLLPHVLPGKLFSPPSHQETAGAGDASRRAAQTAAVNATCLPDSGQVEQTSSSALPGNDPGSEPVGGKTQRTRRISLKRPIKRVSSNPYVQAAFAEEIEELSSDEDLDTEDGYSDLEDFIVCDAETDYGKLLAKRRRFAAKANRAV